MRPIGAFTGLLAVLLVLLVGSLVPSGVARAQEEPASGDEVAGEEILAKIEAKQDEIDALEDVGEDAYRAQEEIYEAVNTGDASTEEMNAAEATLEETGAATREAQDELIELEDDLDDEGTPKQRADYFSEAAADSERMADRCGLISGDEGCEALSAAYGYGRSQNSFRSAFSTRTEDLSARAEEAEAEIPEETASVPAPIEAPPSGGGEDANSAEASPEPVADRSSEGSSSGASDSGGGLNFFWVLLLLAMSGGAAAVYLSRARRTRRAGGGLLSGVPGARGARDAWTRHSGTLLASAAPPPTQPPITPEPSQDEAASSTKPPRETGDGYPNGPNLDPVDGPDDDPPPAPPPDDDPLSNLDDLLPPNRRPPPVVRECPSCGADASESAAFCGNCGATLGS